MIKVLLFDFARVFLFTKDKSYKGELNALHRKLSENPDYNFLDYFYFDDELINYVKENKLNEKYEVNMFTSGTIQETPESKKAIKGIFKEMFSAEKLQISKIDPAAYLSLAKKMKVKPEEIVFIDDRSENTKAAQLAGFQTINYRNISQLTSFLNHKS